MNFSLIGAAGYIAPRHMRAIRDTGNTLVAALDKNDSVGIIDSYFPEADFFTEFERFDRHLEKLKHQGTHIDYVSICTPNYLHDAHIRFGLRHGADVICEKPMVLNPWNVDLLREVERETGKRIWNILQLRLHPSLIALKEQIDDAPAGTVHDVVLTYITPRGKWYYASWKGNPERSGGIATNIGIHFFDMLLWLFGPVTASTVHLHTHDRAAGFLQLQRARVQWFLSINTATLPPQANGRTYRSIRIDGREVEFSEGFTDLHTLSYQAIFQDRGFGIDAAAPAIQLAHDIRNATPVGMVGEYHELTELTIAQHPFRKI